MRTQIWVWAACLAGAVIIGCGGDSSGIKPSGIGECGDGVWNEGEECDDANLNNGDGCSAFCEVEPGYTCSGNVCELIKAGENCGNGVIDDGEVCDDANTNGGDGCAANCLFVEDGYECPEAGGACKRKEVKPPPVTDKVVCGDSKIGDGEYCDDGNSDDGDGCSSECKVEPGYECPAAGESCRLIPVSGGCGDGTLDDGEECDDNNRENGDGCSEYCELELGWNCDEFGCHTTCGDGYTAGTEKCDDSNTDDGDGCSADCSALEDGFECMDVSGLTICMEKGCGNYQVEGSEECDEGEESKDQEGISYGWREKEAKPYCFMCHYSGYCGDGKVNGDEECDEGVVDSNGNPQKNEHGLPVGGDGSYGHCTADCKFAPRCGDGEIQKGEDCDKGKELNVGGYSLNPSTDICTLACTFGSYCGDNVVDSAYNEECDDGIYGNIGVYGGCTKECKKAPFCGDSIVDTAAGEECDNGSKNTPSDYGTCNSSTCTWNAICGDGHIDTANGEECDDGVFINGKFVGNDGAYEGCTADCKKASYCGDGILDAQFEDCDGVAGCSKNCTPEPGFECKNNVCTPIPCGNGKIDDGEECDDGIAAQKNYCKSCSALSGYVCKNSKPYACPTNIAGKYCAVAGVECILITDLYGDGIISNGFEECDDGNKNDNDGCTKGYIDPGYICPEAGSRCKAAACGDGILAYGEECDDGNVESGDGCSARCKREEGYRCDKPGSACTASSKIAGCFHKDMDIIKCTCGDGIVQFGEECDDGNVTGGDGCSASCIIEAGYECKTDGGPCSNIKDKCGNGVIDKTAGYTSYEECDLGTANNGAGKGCDSNCRLTPGAYYDDSNTLRTGSCGDGILGAGEQCDAGSDCSNGKDCNAGNCGTCSASSLECRSKTRYCNKTCEIEPIFECPDAKNGWCQPICGDGLQVPGLEECDDGNAVSGDGCSSLCKIEKGWDCKTDLMDTSGNINLPITYRDFLRYLSASGGSIQNGSTTDGNGYLTKELFDSLPAQCKSEADGNTNPLYRYASGVKQPSYIVKPGRPDPDFLSYCPTALCQNVVAFELGKDGLPDLNAPDQMKTLSSAGGLTKSNDFNKCSDLYTCPEMFKWWYTDVPGLNKRIDTRLVLEKQNATTYKYGPDASFYPINGKGYTSGNTKNGEFTSQFKTYFKFKDNTCDDPTLSFNGDDDVWVFFNRRLGVDVGGIHGAWSKNIKLTDEKAAELHMYSGGIYPLEMFHAERCTGGSSFELTLAGFLPMGTSACTCKDNSLCSNTCGNGSVEAGEECDCGSTGKDCKNASGASVICIARTCKLSSCGDGVLDTANGEECDLGSDKNGKSNSYCNSQCKIQTCGDGEVGPGEECDQGKSNSATAYGLNKCTNECKFAPYCGDGVVDAANDEACDNGKANKDTAYGETACSTQCKRAPYCGDGVVNGREKCDSGTANNNGQYGGCNADCTMAPRCGDKIVDDGEQCDNGAANNDSAYGATACLSNCTKAPYCGDGSMNGPEGREMCDNGNDNSATAYGPNACTDKCMNAGYCGDGIKNGNEACDNGADNNVDGVYGGCSSSCTRNGYCGDGIKNGPEECDYVETTDGSCTTLCKKKIN